MIKYLSIITIIVISLFFSSCVPSKENLKTIFQTNLATSIKKDSENLQELLVKFKSKLDKRNPNNFNKNLESKIYSAIKNENRKFYIRYENNVLNSYKEYLQIAFSKGNVNHRNDYLVLGLYYLIDYSYETDEGHRITALQYDKDKLVKLHKNLQIIKWKIKVDKDFNGNYLFLTWQNNWQIQLEKKSLNNEQLSIEEITKLKAIEEDSESILDPSNFSFEVVLTQMIDKVENSLKALGEEPQSLSIGALKSMFIFL